MNFRDFCNAPETQKRNDFSFRDYRNFKSADQKREPEKTESIAENEQDPLSNIKGMNLHTGMSRFIGVPNNSGYIPSHNQSGYIPPQAKSVYIPPNASVYMPPPNPQRNISVYMPQSAYIPQSKPTAPPPVPIPEPPEIPLEIPPETPPPPIDPNVVRAMNPLPSHIKKKPETPKIQPDLNKSFGDFGGTFDNNPDNFSADDVPVFD